MCQVIIPSGSVLVNVSVVTSATNEMMALHEYSCGAKTTLFAHGWMGLLICSKQWGKASQLASRARFAFCEVVRPFKWQASLYH